MAPRADPDGTAAPDPDEAPSLRVLPERLRGILSSLEAGLVERGPIVRLALLAALAGEHVLLVGPPGTAKSQLARRLHLAFEEGRYFERLLTRFTVPEELFGPLSIRALEDDRYERQTAGFLPQASVAFIDEVFKANSAILNALLTLLNEREFDNGARRERCPLISAIGATNEVPEDEVGEAFFDRFLVRLPVAPVSGPGFRLLLELDPQAPPTPVEALRRAEREAISRAAGQVLVPEEIGLLLGELRAWLAAEGAYVSDRRWVKITWLLRIAAATEGRAALSLWDLWLLPWCTAPDAARQASVASWLGARLGLGTATSPPRLTRVVEAFEAQVELEHAADELDYDERGRLRLGAEVVDQVADAKGGAAAARMSFARKRRYGPVHVAARLRQVDELAERVEGYLAELGARRENLARYREQSVWIDLAFARQANESLAAAAEAVRALRHRVRAARERFEALPRHPANPGVAPPPIDAEPRAT